jgi:hypothetical protein
MDASNRVLFRTDIDELRAQIRAGVDPPAFQLAGPRESIYCNPAILKCEIVTCGGLCPGLNDVIRQRSHIPGDRRRPNGDNILTSRGKTYWYPATIRAVVNSDNAAALS